MNEDYDVVFPPTASGQPLLIKDNIMTRENWNKYRKDTCKFKKSFT
jgi:hypothetical protein